MEKKTYYVSVQANSVLEEQGAAAFEFEIEATPEEVAELSELFEQKLGVEDANFWRAHTPYLQYHDDQENDEYDYFLREIYRMLHKLGTKETREHIERMGVLQP